MPEIIESQTVIHRNLSQTQQHERGDEQTNNNKQIFAWGMIL